MTKIEELKALNQKDEEKIKTIQKRIQNRNEKRAARTNWDKSGMKCVFAPSNPRKASKIGEF